MSETEIADKIVQLRKSAAKCGGMRSLLWAALTLGCQTPQAQCPVTPCPSCHDEGVTDDVALEDCENRLGRCLDGRAYYEMQAKDCVQILLKKKKARK